MLFKRKTEAPLLDRIRNWLWPRRSWRRSWSYVWHRVTRISATPHAIALGFSMGVLSSFTPFMGFHFLLGGLLALLVRGNILASAFGTFVGNPLTFPFIWIGTYNLGGLILGYRYRESVQIAFPDGMLGMLFHDPIGLWNAFWSALAPVLFPMIVGAVIIGPPVVMLCYFVVRSLVGVYQARRRQRLSVNGRTKPREDTSAV